MVAEMGRGQKRWTWLTCSIMQCSCTLWSFYGCLAYWHSQGFHAPSPCHVRYRMKGGGLGNGRMRTGLGHQEQRAAQILLDRHMQVPANRLMRWPQAQIEAAETVAAKLHESCRNCAGPDRRERCTCAICMREPQACDVTTVSGSFSRWQNRLQAPTKRLMTQ